MQLFNTNQTQLEAMVNSRLLDVLEDIVNQVEIQSNFSIRHPDYKPLEIPAEAVERFQSMPEDIQQKYLSLNLQSFLYGIYYNGSMRTTLALEKDTNAPILDLENNTVLGIDVGFYQRLDNSNNGTGYFDSGWSIVREESDGSLAVIKGGLRLHIERDKHLATSEQSATVGDSVAIHMPKNLVQNGFYVAVSNLETNRLEKDQSVTVRVYFNFTPEGAIAVMGSLTQKLNQIEIPFHFKVLYNPKDYERHDSGVLYFDKSDYEVVGEVLQTVYAQHQSHFQSETPLFTLEIAPGLGLAEEPDFQFAEQESFGINRCQIVANGLLEAWYQGDDSTEGRMRAILKQFSMLGIDLQRVYLNANSEDIYRSLDISI
ncbi:MAG: T3SS effector HopA1 family protein [Nostocaceae cyanobacterium]|nr:T3SS effector HopA1 family protein [Nostocaceae cyanobacterium]